MSDSASKYAGHAATNGDWAKYLEDENPNCPVDRLGERFRNDWTRKLREESLPRIRANYKCPECRSCAVYYTDTLGVARCDGCGLSILETDKDADDVVKEGL